MIKISRNIIDAIIKQAYTELPNEACGLLVGKTNEVLHQYPLTNIDKSPEHFSFDPAEQFNVLREARAKELAIVANYHSHPSTPARPSEEDIRLAFDPNIVYIIVSLTENLPSVKAFRIQEGKSTEVQIEIVS
jgi:[CysO sulfur-carrier protein]-S-L-cysteine hydrolase